MDFETLKNRAAGSFAGILAILYYIVIAPLVYILKQVSELGTSVFTEATNNRAYGIFVGAIITIAILLNFAAFDPTAETTDIYKYLYAILGVIGSAFAYMLVSRFSGNEPSEYGIIGAFMLLGLMFGAAFYFYSMGLTYPILSVLLCGIAYIGLKYIAGTAIKYVVMALTSVALLFGLALYYLSNNADAVPTTILYALSGILTFATIIALAIIFYFYSNYLKTVGGWGGWIVNLLFYVPCLVLDFISYIKREVGLTSHLVYYLFLLELIAALLYIYIPKLVNKVTESEGKPLLPDTVFLDIKKELGSGEALAFINSGYAEDAVTTYKRSYSISMWIYLNIQPPNYASYAKEREIFNYGDGLPKVTYVNNVDTDGSKTPDVLKVYYTNKGLKANQSYTVNIKPQKWNQIVFNYTSTQVDLFINGHLEKTFVFDGNEPEYLASDVISVGSTDGLDGAICNVKYHYVPQSKSQIATSYNLLMKQNPPTNIL
jgi:hypothetical protein